MRKKKRAVQGKDRDRRSMRERVKEGKEENSMTLHMCELTGNHSANQPYSTV